VQHSLTRHEDLQRLALRALDGDDAARAQLVEAALPLICRLAERYAGRGIDTADLQQEGVLGVLRALGSYDPQRGAFDAWASIWVRQALQQAIAEQTRPVRLPRHVLWDLHQLKNAQTSLAQRLGRDPRDLETADALGWPVERVGRVLALGQEPGQPEAIDLVEDPLSRDAYDDVITRLAARQITALFTHLTKREREILERRAAGATLRTIGRELGASAQRIDAISQRASSKLAALAQLNADRSECPEASAQHAATGVSDHSVRTLPSSPGGRARARRCPD
jgi:RNA polymerase sigma factor (sigma-70 family)